MAGRIRDDDVALVRDTARIDEVVREYVTLRPAGGGSMKGLCPFHDERGPSFHVTPSRGMFYCFGCGEGGDVISFLQKIDHVSFAEAVEKLAGRFGVTLRYVEGTAAVNRQAGQRTRLVEAHKVAAAFYVEQLQTPEAQIGRTFLADRGFGDAAIKHFGVGYAPKSWDSLLKHLRGKGFSDAEIQAGGLVSQGNRGIYDRFRGRLVWPIRDAGGDVIGFGARKLYDDDEGPKYLNTPETPIYKKSQVLYGIDLARRDIAKQQQAVVVEGYTDVMACHLAGVTTAVATCGTAFGGEHVNVLRRLLMDDSRMRGEVIFTFDGDAAGQKAALRAFEDDQRFVANTFVAVEPSGLDPCELRQRSGDPAIRDLINRRVPLFEFAIKSMLSAFDLNTPEGRVAGLREAAPVVAKIKDPALRPEYARLLAGWLGMEPEAVSRAVGGRGANQQVVAPTPTGVQDRPNPRDPVLVAERESLKAALQQPLIVSEWYATIDSSAFTSPSYALVHAAIVGAGGPSAELDGLDWVDAVLANCLDDNVRGLVRELAVEPQPAINADRYGVSMIARLLEIDATRRVAEIRGQMQRAEPEEQTSLLGELAALDTYRRNLREHIHGA